jgi:DNA helicase HerA-like ATPase
MGASAWQALRDLDSWRVTEIPRQAPERSQQAGLAEGDRGAAQRLAALVSAFHSGEGPVAVGWLRLAEGGPVHVLAGGAGLAGGAAPAERVVLSLPAGARGEPLPAEGMGSAFARLPCWLRIAGLADGLLVAPGQIDDAVRQRTRPSFEDGLLAVWPGPFGWLVLAEPAGAGLLEQVSAEAASRLRTAQGFAERAPEIELEARRLQVRLSEWRQAAGTGMWRVHLLTGSVTPQDAARVAGLMCASADLAHLPYALVPAHRSCGTLDVVLDSAAVITPDGPGLPGRDLAPFTPPSGGAMSGRAAEAPEVEEALGIKPPGEHGANPARSPFHGSTALLAALARPPAREVPGVRFVLRPEFDVTPETPDDASSPGTDPAGVPLGVVLDRQRLPGGPLNLRAGSLNRHTFVCGATGAGKSQTIRHLLEAATAARVPWLVVEPAKAEYQLMAARLPGAEVIRVRPGEPDGIPAGINPLEPAAGPGGTRFPLQTHADLVRALFLAAFEAEEPFPQVLAAALTRCYEQAGWDLALGESAGDGITPAYPSLGDLQQAAGQVVGEIGYGREITDNVRGFIKVRISSLRLGTTGRFFEGGHPLDFAKLLERNVVFEIEDVGDDQDKAFLMGTVLIRLTEHLRMRHRGHRPAAPGLRHLTVIEEAHRLLRNSQPGQRGAAAHAVEMFAALLAEIRAYGEGLIIAEQIPAKLIPDVIKNTAVKIVHRLPAADDREAVGATMNLTDEQSQYLVTLAPGEAAVFTDGMDYPLLARMPDGSTREASTPAGTATPASIVAPRSASCGPDCQANPCTLRDMRAAWRAADGDRRIIVWAELSVLAHLTGWTMPMPGPAFAAALRTMKTRLRDCVLSHTVDDAVASRAPVTVPLASPAALAGHVTAAMRAALDDQQWLCGRAEHQYLAPCYRWALVLDSLKTYHRKNHNAGRHPRSADWETTYGQPIPGGTCARQLGAVQRWYDAGQRNHQLARQVAYGTHPATAIEHAAGARSADDDWEQRLADTLTAFRECRWPLDYLHPATTAPATRT